MVQASTSLVAWWPGTFSSTARPLRKSMPSPSPSGPTPSARPLSAQRLYALGRPLSSLTRSTPLLWPSLWVHLHLLLKNVPKNKTRTSLDINWDPALDSNPGNA
eukprot:4904194-Amphidinium_carterae.1